MPEEIQKIKDQVVPVLKEAGVLRSSLFGSVVRGESRPDSDIDMLVELPSGKTLFDLIDLQDQLEKILGKKVDIGTYRSIKKIVRDQILKEQVLIYER